MKCFGILTTTVLMAATALLSTAQSQDKTKYTATAKKVYAPKFGNWLHFTDRKKMKANRPQRQFALKTTPAKALPAPALPIDWAKKLAFPIDGNDRYGDCMYAAAVHADNTFTGNVGAESTFDQQTLINRYMALSSGDNGLDEGQIVNEWKNNGLAGVKQAVIIDALDIDPTDQALAQAAIYYFGGIQFMLAVPDSWINLFTGSGNDVFDAPATPNPDNGHGVWWNGVDAQGRYKLQTWGSSVWITPEGVKVCDPTAFVVFSPRWFNAQTGYASNGKHITELAQLWKQAGGNDIPAAVIAAFPPPSVVPPGPIPTPTPTPCPTPNYSADIRIRIDVWINNLPQYAFPKKQ